MRTTIVDEARRLEVRAERVEYGPDVDGSPLPALRYAAGVGAARVEVEIAGGGAVQVYLDRRELDLLPAVRLQLPALLAVLTDPRVHALVERAS